MRIIVSKFGGSSTAGAAQFERILSIVRASPARRCIVLSAPGIDSEHGEKMTESLESCWLDRGDPEALGASVSAVADRFDRLGNALGVEGMGDLARREIMQALQESRARTLSRGEFLCAALFSCWSGIPMVDAADAISFHENGLLDESCTASRLGRLLDGQERVVLPGFYGADAVGRIHVFPRNGSDITGALASAELGAVLYENWTDVPGLMTADPAIVPEARLVPQIGYRQMRALARAGARVLHPGCLDPVCMAGIPTRLRCTGRRECYGTLIDEHMNRTVPCLAGARQGGAECALISLFGLPEGQALKAAEELSPLWTRSDAEAVRVCVKSAHYGEALRSLHRALLE